MFSELKKSVSSILYERLSSPFYGTLLATWLVWNWKIPYLTFFVSEKIIEVNKIDYIVNNFTDSDTLILYPLYSTAVILTLAPLITNSSFWLHIKYNKWRFDQKNTLEMKTLLTLEQSIQLREEILQSEERLESLLERKNQDIKELNIKIDKLSKAEPAVVDERSSGHSHSESIIKDMAGKINNNIELKKSFDETVMFIQGGYSNLLGSDNVSPKSIAYLEANQIISNKGGGNYSLTDLGKKVLKEVLDNSY